MRPIDRDGLSLKKEGAINFWAGTVLDSPGPGTKRMGVFYNKAMEPNRDITIVLLHIFREMGWLPSWSHDSDEFDVLDGMGASGVRGLRIALEVGGCSVVINDIDPKSVEVISLNGAENDIGDVEVVHGDVKDILSHRSFSFVDIDPFGTPAPFIESGVKGVRNGGILAITATDTAPLFGRYFNTCLRRYDAVPYKDYFSHEVALRILAGFVVRKAASMDIAAYPIFSYSQDHYYRSYFRVRRGATRADELLSDINFVAYNRSGFRWKIIPRTSNLAYSFDTSGLIEDGWKVFGPLYTGDLVAPGISEKILGLKWVSGERATGTIDNKKRCDKMLSILAGETGTLPFFYCTHELSRSLGFSPPKLELVLEGLKLKGISALPTYFSPTGIKISSVHRVANEEVKILALLNNLISSR